MSESRKAYKDRPVARPLPLQIDLLRGFCGALEPETLPAEAAESFKPDVGTWGKGWEKGKLDSVRTIDMPSVERNPKAKG